MAITGTWLTAPLGGTVTPSFKAAGVGELYLIKKDLILTYDSIPDAFGADVNITDFTLASGATFQQVKMVKDATSVNSGYKLAGSQKFYNVALAFQVDAIGADIIAQNHQIILGGPYVALYKRKAGHKYFVAGLSDGLECTQLDTNSGAKAEDESANVYLLAGINLGDTPVFSGTIDSTLVTKYV